MPEGKKYKIRMSPQVEQFMDRLLREDPEKAALLHQAFDRIAKSPEKPDMTGLGDVTAVDVTENEESH